MERLTVMKSRKLAGPASLANILKTVDNIFANRCSRRLGRPIQFNSSSQGVDFSLKTKRSARLFTISNLSADFLLQ